MPTITLNVDGVKMDNASNAMYNTRAIDSKNFRIEVIKLESLKALAGDLIGILNGYRFGVDVWAASPAHNINGNCTVCPGDFSKLSTIRSVFIKSAVTYSSYDQL